MTTWEVIRGQAQKVAQPSFGIEEMASAPQRSVHLVLVRAGGTKNDGRQHRMWIAVSARATATNFFAWITVDVACGAAHCAEMMIALSVEARMSSDARGTPRSPYSEARRGERGQSEREPRRGWCPHVQGGEAKSMDSLDLQWVKSKKGCCLLGTALMGF